MNKDLGGIISFIEKAILFAILLCTLIAIVFELLHMIDEKFIELARAVYMTNDQRFEVKNNINKLFNSEYVEEKSYEDY